MVASVYFIRPELMAVLDAYRMIQDCIGGSRAVKWRRELYLPMPNATDKSKENKARYDGYLRRAVFYNATARTLAGMLGLATVRPPVIEIPDSLNIIKQDADGAGLSLMQVVSKILMLTFAYSRCGLLVDYPETDASVTVEQLQSGEIRPTLTVFDPKSIINWRTAMFGAERRLTLVVIAELFPFHDDGFEIKQGCQFRVLKLDPDTANYTVEIWSEQNPTEWSDTAFVPGKGKTWQMRQRYVPTGPDGEPLKEIPFTFIGAFNNDPDVDLPLMQDLADLNIAHFRNSADYEESCYVVGQPTPWVSGLTKEWVNDVMKGELRMGSQGGVMLPVNGAAGLLQVEPNTMVKEAMDQKERQMVALGAKLVQQQTVQRTATEANLENVSETSIMSTVAHNVSKAVTWAMRWCLFWNGEIDDPNEDMGDTVKVELNSDYSLMNIDPQTLAQIIANWQKGATSFSEMRAVLRNAGYATLDDDEAKTEIEAEQASAIDQAMKMAAAQAAGSAQGNPNANA